MAAETSSSLELPQQCRQFTISEIHLATRNFDESLVIGRGGFGLVYKGTITNGATQLVVAIKRLEATSNQGAAEFWNEVQMLSKLRHCHLVSLIGYCNDGQEMILVYEYMPRGSLEDHLHKLHTRFTWVLRLKICIGVARGLDYLHTGTGIKLGIIHRDIKSSNILLDDSWAAKISDFGLSKLGPINQPYKPSYVNTLVKGTFGYLDPDYFATGRLTRKSDVYAFGVVLLEVLTGKRAVDRSLDEEHWGLINWAQESMKEGRLKQIVDYNIRERILPKCLKEFARLADRCLHSNPKQRPTMAEVVACLESVLTLQEKAMAMEYGRKRLTPLELYFDTIGREIRILHKFEFATINTATENFSPDNMIHVCGHRYTMYKGRLQNGQGILVSKYESDFPWQECKNELFKLEHENLLGYSITGTQVSLVYDIAVYASLNDLIAVENQRSLELYFNTIGGENRILHRFEFRIINVATQDFSEENKISRWGYHVFTMYKGTLEDGQDVTISRYHPKFGSLYYTNEVALLVKLEHENLLKLLGYSIEETQVFLVYEFPVCGSLDRMLFDRGCTLLDWNRREKIIMAVARALLYLHHHDVIHGNVKPGNIVLDESFAPKLSDFGLARCSPVNEVNQPSTKDDVYGYGVLILEILTGYNIHHFTVQRTLSQVWRDWWLGKDRNIIDRRIHANLSTTARFILIGLLCISKNAADRPTMEEVVVMLADKNLSIPQLPMPTWIIEYESDVADDTHATRWQIQDENQGDCSRGRLQKYIFCSSWSPVYYKSSFFSLAMDYKK